MLRLVLRRLAEMVVVLLVLTAVVFVLRQLQPADPARVAVGFRASTGAVEEYRRELGLNKPMLVQYVTYLGKVVQGDFQVSVRTRRPVSEDLAVAIPATLELAAVALLRGGGRGPGSRRRGRGEVAWDRRHPGGMIFGASIPVFLLAYGGILIFSRRLGWLPGTGRTSFREFQGPTGLLLVDSLIAGRFDVFTDAIRHLILPAITIALLSAVSIGRVLRSSLYSTLHSPYARTARAKGLPERVVIARHGLRNASGPAISMAGLQLGFMFAGIVIVETIFAWPGSAGTWRRASPRTISRRSARSP